VSEVNPAIVATTSVTIQSSVESNPMEIGGTTNAAVNGINLTSAELAQIVTSASGTIAFGDTNQTGNITFAGAKTATTAGASTNVDQSTTGGGQILFDNTNGIALNGNGGLVSLTPGTGELSGTLNTTGALIASNGFTASGLTLSLALGFAPSSATTITLVADSGTPISGSFNNLTPNGTIVLSNGGTNYTFAISYSSSGNNLVLNYTPPAAPVSPAPAVVQPSVTFGFGPQGEVVEVVASTGILTQYDSNGAHVLFGGVVSASVAFGPQGEVLAVVDSSGTLTLHSSSGSQVIAGGVASASVGFGPTGELLLVTMRTGAYVQYDSFGTQVLTQSLRGASVTFGPQGEVLEVIDSTGTLTQFDATGTHVIASGIVAASASFGPQGEILDVIDAAGTLLRYASSGSTTLSGNADDVSVAFGPPGETLAVVDTTGTLTQYTPTGAQTIATGVVAATLSFGPEGEILLVLNQDGSYVQYDSTGSHVLYAGDE
jgi:hypothetical protein